MTACKKSTGGIFFPIVTYRFFYYDQQATSLSLYYNVPLHVLIYISRVILWGSSKVLKKAPFLGQIMWILKIYTWDLM